MNNNLHNTNSSSTSTTSTARPSIITEEVEMEVIMEDNQTSMTNVAEEEGGEQEPLMDYDDDDDDDGDEVGDCFMMSSTIPVGSLLGLAKQAPLFVDPTPTYMMEEPRTVGGQQPLLNDLRTILADTLAVLQEDMPTMVIPARPDPTTTATGSSSSPPPFRFQGGVGFPHYLQTTTMTTRVPAAAATTTTTGRDDEEVHRRLRQEVRSAITDALSILRD